MKTKMMFLSFVMATASKAQTSHQARETEQAVEASRSTRACKVPLTPSNAEIAAYKLAAGAQMEFLIYKKVHAPELFDAYLKRYALARKADETLFPFIMSSTVVGIPVALVGGFLSSINDDLPTSNKYERSFSAGWGSLVIAGAGSSISASFEDSADKKAEAFRASLDEGYSQVATELIDYLRIEDPTQKHVIRRTLEHESRRLSAMMFGEGKPDPADFKTLLSKLEFVDQERLQTLQLVADAVRGQVLQADPPCTAMSISDVLKQYDAWEEELNRSVRKSDSRSEAERRRLLARINKDRAAIEILAE